MSSGLGAVVTYALLVLLWSAILGLYVRYYRAARGDKLLTMLLTVLIIDASKTLIESVYFGLTRGVEYGVLPAALEVLRSPVALTVVKWLNVGSGVVVLGWLVMRWLPAEVAEREARQAEADRLRHDTEESLRLARANEERFHLATLASRDFVWDADLRTGAIYHSPRLPELLGVSAEVWAQEKHRWLATLLMPEDRRRVRDAVVAALKGLTPTYEVRARLTTPDGRTLTLQLQGACVHENGRATRLVGFVRDVTVEAEAEARRLETQKLESLGLLAGGIAHDFNNLLTVMSTGLMLAQRQLPAGPTDALRTVEVAVARASTLTRQLLAYVGQKLGHREPIDVNGLVESMSVLLQVSASSGVRFTHHLAPNLPRVQAEEAQLQQVVMNVISNAVDAIGEAEGSITIETEAVDVRAPLDGALGEALAGPAVRLRVTDTGSGMTPEVRARIFDPFYSTHGRGRGLGLAAVLGIIRSHGGALTIDTAPGRGTTFSLYFPVAQPEAAGASDASPTSTSTAPLRVLVVDDEALLRRVAARLFSAMGCVVTEASSGDEALEKARADTFDVVLMDYSMPGMTGAEAARCLAEEAPGLSVVLSSGYADAMPAELPPTVRLFPKPWDAEALEALLRELRGGARGQPA